MIVFALEFTMSIGKTIFSLKYSWARLPSCWHFRRWSSSAEWQRSTPGLCSVPVQPTAFKRLQIWNLSELVFSVVLNEQCALRLSTCSRTRNQIITNILTERCDLIKGSAASTSGLNILYLNADMCGTEIMENDANVYDTLPAVSLLFCPP